MSWLQAIGEGPERRFERRQLDDVAAGVARFPAFVLLGPPGSGKSTVLERLVYTAARDYLLGRSRRLPLWVTLASYRWPQPPPEFIQAEWAAKAAGSFGELARAGQMLLLLDGLNEMPRLDRAEERAGRAAAWKRFVDDYFADESPLSSRLVLACRDAGDYEQRLGLPRVEIDPLTPDQAARLAQAYLAAGAGPFLAALAGLGLAEQAKNPLALFILTQLYRQAGGQLPANRGRLLAQYAAGLLSVMYPYREKEQQAALVALAELGFAMQARGEGTVLPAAELLALLPAQVRLPGQPEPLATPPQMIFDQARWVGLLSLVDEAGAGYKFSHQLLQEQFAARRLLARRQNGEDLAGLWQAPRRQAEMPAPEIGEWDPLPPPPPTGWEQAAILAAGLAGQPDAFIREVLAAQPALAGRCLNEGGPVVSAETRAAVQQALLRDLGDPALHRRTRLQAGRVLAAVVDPRLEPVDLTGVNVIWPELVKIPSGQATLGSAAEEAYQDEQPVHQVEVAPFYLGRWPVTNAEYRCFIEAGGYETERYWTPAGWQWRQGQAETSGAAEQIMETRRTILQNPQLLEQGVREGWLMPNTAEHWRELTQLSDEAARERVSGWYPVRPHEQPYYWSDPAYNSANQPVVGVTWYEAMAYCAWLNECLQDWANSEETNNQQRVTHDQAALWIEVKSKVQNLKSKIEARLPTEAEWEWAAGGPAHTRYPWGDQFDVDKANTLEGRVLAPSPVGAYPAGAAACGALDLAGNVWEWTHSLYQDYPYSQTDGREDPDAGGRRALRGGAWFNSQRGARAPARDSGLPGGFNDDVGLRVVVAPCLPPKVSDS